MDVVELEIVMVQDSIQLCVKRPQGKSLSCAKLRGFFYGGSDFSVGKPVYALIGTGLSRRGHYSAVIKRRQHLILQTICRWAASYLAAPHLTLCLKLNRLSCPSATLCYQLILGANSVYALLCKEITKLIFMKGNKNGRNGRSL